MDLDSQSKAAKVPATKKITKAVESEEEEQEYDGGEDDDEEEEEDDLHELKAIDIKKRLQSEV